MTNGLIFALVCAFAALVYGGLSIRWIVAQPTGNDRMREIAAAIQCRAHMSPSLARASSVKIVRFFTALAWPKNSRRLCLAASIATISLGVNKWTTD